jgi:hypothetical protein
VINDDTLRYSKQPLCQTKELADAWGVPRLEDLEPPLPLKNRTDLVYLDVWEREVDSEDEFDQEFPPSMVNPDIGIETCVRLKREWVVRVDQGITGDGSDWTPPEDILLDKHVYYALALWQHKWRPKGTPPKIVEIITATDLRRTGLNLAALEDEIADARGEMDSLGSRLDAPIEESKVRFSTQGHAHDGEDSSKVSPSDLREVSELVTADNLNRLTGGENASDLHHHISIPEQKRQYAVSLTPFRIEGRPEFLIDPGSSITARAGEGAAGKIPLHLPHGTHATAISVWVEADTQDRFRLGIQLVQQTGGGSYGIPAPRLEITSKGAASEELEDVWMRNGGYLLVISVDEPGTGPITVQNLYIDYEVVYAY